MGTLQVRVEYRLSILPLINSCNVANEPGHSGSLQAHKYPLPGKPHLGVNVKVNARWAQTLPCVTKHIHSYMVNLQRALS
jgi:hypothetical protein